MSGHDPEIDAISRGGTNVGDSANIEGMLRDKQHEEKHTVLA